MTYFYKGRLVRDIDNILKHTIDAFIKVMYKDDRSIKFCLSQAINCDNAINPIDITDLDADVIMNIQGNLYQKVLGANRYGSTCRRPCIKGLLC